MNGFSQEFATKTFFIMFVSPFWETNHKICKCSIIKKYIYLNDLVMTQQIKLFKIALLILWKHYTMFSVALEGAVLSYLITLITLMMSSGFSFIGYETYF